MHMTVILLSVWIRSLIVNKVVGEELHSIPTSFFNNFSNHLFAGTCLDEIVNFRYKGVNATMFAAGSIEHQMEQQEPVIFSKFDWVFWPTFGTDNMQGDLSISPRSVLAKPSIPILKYIPELRSHEKRVLVLAGEDRKNRFLENVVLQSPFGNFDPVYLSKRFTSVFVEAKTIRSDHYKTVPMGFTNFYIFNAGPTFVTDVIRDTKSAGKEAKKHLVFAAWGKYNKVLDSKLPDREKLVVFMEKKETQVWVQRQQLNMKQYWTTLAQFKFALCPAGNGVQAPKLFEALAVRTVPVVLSHAAFIDLIALGFPFLMVNTWDDLSAVFLEDQYKRIYQHVDWDIVYKMMTVDGVWSLLMNETRYPFDSPLQHLPPAAQQRLLINSL